MAQAPLMPRTMRPLPSQFAQRWPSFVPLPSHAGQMSSPVPGVPGGASSPGAGGVRSGRSAFTLQPSRLGS